MMCDTGERLRNWQIFHRTEIGERDREVDIAHCEAAMGFCRALHQHIEPLRVVRDGVRPATGAALERRAGSMSAPRRPRGGYDATSERYGVTRRWLRRFGLAKFLAMREDVRELYVRMYHQRKAVSK